MATVLDVIAPTTLPINQAKGRLYLCPLADTLVVGDVVPLSTNDVACKMSRSASSIATHDAGIIPIETPPSWALSFGTISPSTNAKVLELINSADYPAVSNSNLMKGNVILGDGGREEFIAMNETFNGTADAAGGAQQYQFGYAIYATAYNFTPGP